MKHEILKTRLRDCYARSDMSGLLDALSEGADPNSYYTDDLYADRILFQAVIDGNLPAVRLLAAHGGDLVDRKMRYSATILAVFHNRFDILDYLYGAYDVKQLDTPVATSSTPLLQAVTRRNFEMIRYLLAKGCDINGRNEEMGGHTPLDYAVRNGDVEMARFLLELGADPLCRGLSNNTAFEAAKYGDIAHRDEMLSLLQKYV